MRNNFGETDIFEVLNDGNSIAYELLVKILYVSS